MSELGAGDRGERARHRRRRDGDFGLQRNQARLAAWPHVQLGVGADFRLTVANQGVGPQVPACSPPGSTSFQP